MVQTAEAPKSSLAGLKDPRLVRQFAYLGGRWVSAANNATFAVTNPGTGAWLGDVTSLIWQRECCRRRCRTGSL